GVAGAKRTGGSVIPWRRPVVAFAVTFACALVVFTLPRFAWNTLRGAPAAQDTTARAAAPQVQPPSPAAVAAPRPLGARLRGVFGLAALLAIGFGLSSNRRKISWRVIAWGLGLQAAFAVFVLRIPVGQR